MSNNCKKAKRMKSIKEKAQEWADMYPSCGMADKSFKAGANHVLEEIEKLVKFNRWAAQDLYDLLEQLKK